LRLAASTGGVHAVRHFNAMPFLAKSNLQQFADRFLVVDNENMGHLACRFLNNSFCSLHNPSSDSREFYDELSATVFFGYHGNLSAVGLHDLVDDGEPQPSAALKTRL